VTLVDDYAHHPVELQATLSAARGCWPDRRLVVVFQPHRYSRTNDLFEDFVQVLAEQTNLLVCEVYAAGEETLSAASGKSLCQAIRARGSTQPIFVPDVDELANVLCPLIQDGDIVLTLGAGSIGRVAREIYEQFAVEAGQ
jgi:UDP-N-acetylmuramate--alanine ligase